MTKFIQFQGEPKRAVKRAVKRNGQCGFSLLEVLIAMLIAAVAVGGMMLIHANNLRQVSGNAELNRAQTVLVNMAQRMQVNADGLRSGAYVGSWKAATSAVMSCAPSGCDASTRAIHHDIPVWRNQALEAQLPDAQLSVRFGNGGWLLQIDWIAHDANEVVQRPDCAAAATRHCVTLWVAS